MHDCLDQPHTCGMPCKFKDLKNCNQICALKSGHKEARKAIKIPYIQEDHLCNARQHLCGKSCSLTICSNTCIIPFEMNHDRHECHDTKCIVKCPFNCNRLCISENHFHSLEKDAVHYCGQEHNCQHVCEAQGICEVVTALKTEQRTYKVNILGIIYTQGLVSEFQYTYTTEQNGLRKTCSKKIPAFMADHEGPHWHTNNDKEAHYCDEKCPYCGYYCNLPWGHSESYHKTNHGNMREVYFASDDNVCLPFFPHN